MSSTVNCLPRTLLSFRRVSTVARKRKAAVGKKARVKVSNPDQVDQKRAATELPRVFRDLSDHNRFFLRFSSANLVSSVMFSVTTVCHRTSDTKHPLLMITNREGNRFFFGKVPEGAQRVLNENGFRMSKVRSIFMTGIISLWSEIGGLPGLFLTVSDAVSRGLDVYVSSSSVMKYVVATWRYFVFRRDSPLNVVAANEDAVIADASAAFFPVQIAPSPLPHVLQSGQAETQSDPSMKAKVMAQLDKLTSLMFPSSTPSTENGNGNTEMQYVGIQSFVRLPELSQVTGSQPQKSLNFIIRFLPTRGKFNPKRAKELGILPGHDFKRLTSGELVNNSSGDVVHPHQVMGDAKTFPKIAVIDIPNQKYLENTIKSPEWFKITEDRGDEQYGLVYHFLGDDIDFQLEEYLSFINRFPANCTHVMSHCSIADDTLVFKTSSIHILKLKSIMNNNFNLPFFEDVQKQAPASLIKLQSLQTFKIESNGVTSDNSLVQSESWPTLFENHVKATCPNAEFSDSVVPLGPLSNAVSLKDHVQIVTLGTGSALPSIHRNVLSNLIRVPFLDPETNQIRFRGFMLDGGENTIGMLLRNYGHEQRAQLNQILDELCLIFLSHLHADHNLGIITVITAWLEHNSDNLKKLYLVVPFQYRDFLREWFQLEDSKFKNELNRICFITCAQLMRQRGFEVEPLDPETFQSRLEKGDTSKPNPKNATPPLSPELWTRLQADTGLLQFETCPAIHCNWAYSVSMTFNLGENEKFKISFSGDTRPNPKFVEIGVDSDVLIHEASLDDVNIEEAIEKKHTTLVEAVRVSQLMRCRKLVLTHFSTRFSEEFNFIMSSAEYNALVARLHEYLGKSPSNIFAQQVANMPLFEDLDICYAYDLMSVRLNEIGLQKPHFKAIQALSLAENTEMQMKKDEKKERRQMKLFEKRDAKRQQRLGAGQNQSLNQSRRSPIEGKGQ